MAQVLVRDLSEKTVRALKNQAESNNRSLQGEIKLILENVVKRRKDMEKFRREAMKFRSSLARRKFSDSAQLIREDRDR